jgi:hypothetical protein
MAFTHRLFLNRAVRHLMGQGVRQFLDIGSGVPNTGTQAIADEWAVHARRRPDARVVFVDNDPVAVAHTELLLDDEGDRRRHAVVNADLRDPQTLWELVLETELLDPGQPVAVLLVGLLHLRQLDADGNEVGPDSVAALRELVPSDSYVVITHVSDEGLPAHAQETLTGLSQVYDEFVMWRSRAEIESMLGDYRMVDPGWTAAIEWRAEETGPSAPTVSLPARCNKIIWAGVGRKP